MLRDQAYYNITFNDLDGNRWTTRSSERKSIRREWHGGKSPSSRRAGDACCIERFTADSSPSCNACHSVLKIDVSIDVKLGDGEKQLPLYIEDASKSLYLTADVLEALQLAARLPPVMPVRIVVQEELDFAPQALFVPTVAAGCDALRSAYEVGDHVACPNCGETKVICARCLSALPICLTCGRELTNLSVDLAVVNARQATRSKKLLAYWLIPDFISYDIVGSRNGDSYFSSQSMNIYSERFLKALALQVGGGIELEEMPMCPEATYRQILEENGNIHPDTRRLE